MLSKFFLERPVFAWVIAIIIMVLGGLAIYNLPISQYPPIAPPSIAITAFYPGASAETVENSVTQIIEQKMTGFDKMLYLSATSDSSGASRVELTFSPGTDPDLAWAQVQNKLQLAMASLPEVVQRQGIKVSKSTRNYLLLVGLISQDGSMDGHDLQDFAQSNLEKSLSRVPGVGEVEIFGSQYAMRIWLNPDKLTNYQMTIQDVITALRAYNVEVSAGQFGGMPAVEGQRLNASIIVQSLLKTPEEFASIPLRTNTDGAIVRVSDVGRTELGVEFYDVDASYNGKPSAVLAVRQAAGANALDTADAIRAKMEEMSRFFPAGMKVIYPYDTTPFIEVAIEEVVKTLFEAILLVFLVMYLFMGNMRATLIPTIAVPVVLLGTFAALGFFGFSINMLTMFAMVLAIGLLVDDAIVVVENVERIMSEEGLTPLQATRKSMEQITPALIGIGLVLSAVFGPMAFFSGSTGVIYRQFSITIIASMLLSVVVALILTPVLCASLLKPVPKGHEPADAAIFFLRPFFKWFDRNFFRVRDLYVRLVGKSFSQKIRYIFVFVIIVAGMVFILKKMPTAYLPDEDQGILMVQALLPANSTVEQTKQVMDKVRNYFLEQEKDSVDSCMTISGVNFSGHGQNAGMAFVKLRNWKLRNRPDMKVTAVAGRAMGAFSQIRNAMVFAFPPPAVIELGMAKGFDFQLLDRGGLGHAQLTAARNQLLAMAAQNPVMTKVRPNGLEDVPEYRLDVDWEKAGALGLPIIDIHNTISAAFGSAYVNDFIQGGRVKRVYLQADSPYRMLPKDLEKLYVRNTGGKMVPFSSFASGHWTSGSPKLERFNGFPSINIQGEAAPGRSSGEAMAAMEGFMKNLPQGTGFDWTGLSYQERQAGAQTVPLYAFSILIIFLCVAALYESWAIPFVNMLMLPLGVFGATLATWLHGMPNDVYFQIGFLTTLGLSTKNAILIIQFAQHRMHQGEGLIEATLGAVRTRFRPVMMTSLAFFFGVLPLAITAGAGAGAQNAIGTAVCGGMLSATFIDLLFIPLFFVLVSRIFSPSFHGGFEPPVKPAVKYLMYVLITFCLTGCTLIPKYTRPKSPVPDAWPTGAAYKETTAGAPAASELAWREFFTDKRLQKIIETALNNNRDLRIAALNVEKARALYGIQRAELLPTLNTTGSWNRERVAADLSATGKPAITEKYSVNMGIAAWEIDFFGRIRSLKDKALKEYFATEQARRSAQILLISEVAGAYLTFAADQENLQLAKSTLDTQRSAYNLIRRRFETGVVPELDLRQVQTRVDAARVDVSLYTRLAAQGETALNLLVGSPVPGELLAATLSSVSLPKEISAGISSEALLSRPDILQAENLLMAANANIGAARAAFFPRISLTTSVGTASSELSGLFSPGSYTWSFAPQIVMPIFDARLKSALNASKADQKIVLAKYEKSIQTAFKEVADALAVQGTADDQLTAQQSLVDATAETYRLSNERYTKGIDSYLGVMDAQRSLYSARQGLVTFRLAKLANQIKLYAVLGGGGNLPEKDKDPSSPLKNSSETSPKQ